MTYVLPIKDVVSEIWGGVGITLLAGMAGGSSADVEQWYLGKIAPSPKQEARIRFAYDAFYYLEPRLGERHAKAWFISSLVDLGGCSPAELIAIDNFQSVQRAAISYCEDLEEFHSTKVYPASQAVEVARQNAASSDS